MALLAALLLAGCGRGAETTTSGWGAKRAFGSRVTLAAFKPVPSGLLAGARHGHNCNVDKVNGQVAQGMAIDHLGVAILGGWVVDKSTRSIPKTLGVLLTGTRDYWVQGHTGRLRPDVAVGVGIPSLRTAGFDFGAALYQVPIGNYGVAVVFQSDNQWVVCTTKVRISVE